MSSASSNGGDLRQVSAGIRLVLEEIRELREEAAAREERLAREAAEDRARYERQAEEYRKQAAEDRKTAEQAAAARHQEFLQALKAIGGTGVTLRREQKRQTELLVRHTEILEDIRDRHTGLLEDIRDAVRGRGNGRNGGGNGGRKRRG